MLKNKCLKYRKLCIKYNVLYQEEEKAHAKLRKDTEDMYLTGLACGVACTLIVQLVAIIFINL